MAHFSKNKRLLLHVCCAPCAGGIIETLLSEQFLPTILFYNPNIYPLEEYNRRKQEISLFAVKKRLPCIDIDNDPDKWFDRVKGLENEPERGRRCQVCFYMRLERAARYAYENGFDTLATTNSISRWKDIEQVHLAGKKAATPYPSVSFWDRNWRKAGGIIRMEETSKQEDFYRQNYCGCLFSLEAAKNRNKNKTL